MQFIENFSEIVLRDIILKNNVSLSHLPFGESLSDLKNDSLQFNFHRKMKLEIIPRELIKAHEELFHSILTEVICISDSQNNNDGK
jgi:hypothetical protein